MIAKIRNDKIFSLSLARPSQEKTCLKFSFVQKNLPQEVLPTRNELEAWRLKTVMLLRNNGLPKSVLEDFFITPIEVKVESRVDKKIFLKLIQQVEYKGKKVSLEGVFIRPEKAKFSIPFAPSFRLIQETN